MSWAVAVSLLVGLAVLGGLLAWLLPRIRTWILVCLGAAAALVLFLPGVCVTAIASPPGAPVDLDGTTTCRTFYDVELPGAFGDGTTGGLLALAGALAAGAAVLFVRRRQRRSGGPDEHDRERAVR